MIHKKVIYILMILFGLSHVIGMSKPGDLPADEFARRRAIFLNELRELNACAVLHSAPEVERNNDVNFPYRQHSDFIYLTGWSHAHSILVLTPQTEDSDKAEVTFFVAPRNPKMEVWTGPKPGLGEANALPNVDTSFAYSDFFELVGKMIQPYDRLVISYGQNQAFELEYNIEKNEMWGHPGTVQKADELLKAHRLIKSEAEIKSLETAIKITGSSLVDAIKIIPSLNFEYEVQSEIEHGFKKRGAKRLGFPSIVGAGQNSTFLHYEDHSGKIKSGDILLMDVGAEWDYYSADISRTVPANGSFSKEQASLYQIVLDAQIAGIQSIKPGVSFREPHKIAIEEITSGLIKLGLLEGELADLIADRSYRKFFMHGTSHWLGLDVHDAGGYIDAAKIPHLLKPGMVLTVEPGIYISESEDVAEKWWNIGIRIEDDVLVTAKGHRVLSASIPKTIQEIEELMQPR